MIKKILLRFFTFTLSSPERANFFQKQARDIEWDAIKSYIKPQKFLDVGAGAGYAMQKANMELNCAVFGIDPEPKAHGVGRFGSKFYIEFEVKQAYAESIPFDSQTFDTVYSSHVLEHVTNISESLKEMKRVATKDGVIIIGVPTSSMAIINLLSQWILTTHIRIGNALFFGLLKTKRAPFWTIFLPTSHSRFDKSVLYDIKYYSIKRWTKLIENELHIETIILPVLYPYPDYLQLFKPKVNYKKSSSVFFICKP